MASRVLLALWTDHPVITWVFLEVSLASVIPLIPSRSAVRYFLVQSFRSIIFFVGVLFVGLEFFYWLGMALKLGVAPVHWWVPIVYQEVSYSIIFLLRVVMKIVPISILDIGTRLESYLWILVTIRLVIGAVGGLRQTSLKKLLGYSTVSHMGWIFSALASTRLWIPYLALFRLTLGFIVFGSLAGLAKFIILLSLGGLPPLLGFFPKVLVLMIMWKESFFITGLLLITSMISLVFYVRMFVSHVLTHQATNYLRPLMYFMISPLLVFPLVDVMGMFNVTPF